MEFPGFCSWLNRMETVQRKSAEERWAAAYAGLVGAWLGIALLKFGNPVILDRLVVPPADFFEFVFQPWPVHWGHVMLAGLAVGAVPLARFRVEVPRWILWLPLVWLGWQVAAGVRTVNAQLSHEVLKHFVSCVAGFYLGIFVLSRARRTDWFQLAVLAALAWVIWQGLEQHFGGLEATRQFVRTQPNWQQLPAEYLKKLESNRIFSTLVYPNALAGAMLLLLPMGMAGLWQLSARLSIVTRWTLVGILGLSGLGCLYWSGSKSGWLIALVMALVAFLQLKLGRAAKVWIVGTVLAVGLAGFFIKFAPYFQRGATSVGARFDYWRAGVQIARQNPIFGTGPGTFSVGYAKIKAPESEMTRLTHNDYLEQACDSGLVGFLSYTAFVLGSVGLLYRKVRTADWGWFTIWMGVCAWALQGLVEFGLYIPALAWPAFVFLGSLWGGAPAKMTPVRNGIDSRPAGR
ncbi:MAG: O-antigen ligase family protein [Verrucomicrobia bacterium]|nr:O-antigen ligase family protein [Verrucomicrobiota bacterium]